MFTKAITTSKDNMKRTVRLLKKSARQDGVLCVVDWDTWHKLPYKTQCKYSDKFVVLSDVVDWCEDVWVYHDIGQVEFGPDVQEIIVAGSEDHIESVGL